MKKRHFKYPNDCQSDKSLNLMTPWDYVIATNICETVYQEEKVWENI